MPTRIFCSTNHCAMLRAQLDAAQRSNAELRRLLDVTLAQRDAAQAEADGLRAQLAEAQGSVEFYLDLFCAERARCAVGPEMAQKRHSTARNGAQWENVPDVAVAPV